jgi:hypothetical protein
MKRWLFERFFPAVAKEEIATLRRVIKTKDDEIERLCAYIEGLETGIKAQRRVTIRNEVNK